MAENAEFGSINNNCDCEDEIIKTSPLISKNSNGAKSYLTPNDK